MIIVDMGRILQVLYNTHYVFSHKQEDEFCVLKIGNVPEVFKLKGAYECDLRRRDVQVMSL